MDWQPILEEAGKCTFCGMCLQACPTYRMDPREPNSPRGRVEAAALAAAGALGVENAVAAAETCLECGECLPACPTGVDVVRLVKSILGARPPPSLRGSTVAGEARPGVAEAVARLGGRLARVFHCPSLEAAARDPEAVRRYLAPIVEGGPVVVATRECYILIRILFPGSRVVHIGDVG